MKMIRNVIIVILVIVICGALFMKYFPVWFWKQHGKDTDALQVTFITGMNDLEYAYGQDENQPVKQMHFEVNSDTAKEYTVFYPAELEENNETYPVVVWGNGTGNTYVNYEAGLRSLASYGFIVIGCDYSDMGDGKTLYEMGVFARSLNQNDDSIFAGRIREDKIGAAGHSQGACGAVNAVTKYPLSNELFASLYTTSMPKLEMCKDDDRYQFAYWAYDVSKITVPYFATSGTRFLDSMWISPLASMKENFLHLGDIPAYMARQKKANHNIVNEYHGAGYFNAWFCYTLKDDAEAAKVFTDTRELKTNTERWKDFQSQ